MLFQYKTPISHSPATRTLSRQLIRPPHDPRELVNLDILPNHRTLRLILLVQRHLNHRTLNLPSTHLADELIERLTLQSQPRLQHRALDLTHSLRNSHGDTDADQLLEAVDIGDEISVQVVGVECGPELCVRGAGEEVVEDGELLDCFGEGSVAGGGEGSGSGDWLQDVCGEEVEAEREVGGGEDGEGLDEGVGDGLVAG